MGERLKLPLYIPMPGKPVTPSKKINELKLDVVIKQLARIKKDEWDLETVKEISILYRQFLYLHLKYPKMKLAPIYEVDQFWHQHILNTKRYESDCKKVFGKFLHHTVDPRIKGAFMETLKLVKKEFPESY